MRNHVIEGLVCEAGKNPQIMLLTGDLGYNVVEKFAEKYPDRYINCGIAEENMISVAAGLALEGNKVFVYSLGNFPTLRCMEQIRNDVCYHNADVKIISVGGGFSYGSLGVTHHATEELGAMRLLPNMRVYAPADYIEALGVLKELCAINTPCYVRLARGSDERLHPEEVIGNISGLLLFFGDSRTNGQKDNLIVLITAGTMLGTGIRVSDILYKEKIPNAVYSCPTLKPFDKGKLKEIALQAKLIVTLEEHNIIGGLGGAAAEILSEMPEHAPLLRIGLNDEYSEATGERGYLRRQYKMDADCIVKRIMELIQHKRRYFY